MSPWSLAKHRDPRTGSYLCPLEIISIIQENSTPPPWPSSTEFRFFSWRLLKDATDVECTVKNMGQILSDPSWARAGTRFLYHYLTVRGPLLKNQKPKSQKLEERHRAQEHMLSFWFSKQNRSEVWTTRTESVKTVSRAAEEGGHKGEKGWNGLVASDTLLRSMFVNPCLC